MRQYLVNAPPRHHVATQEERNRLDLLSRLRGFTLHRGKYLRNQARAYACQQELGNSAQKDSSSHGMHALRLFQQSFCILLDLARQGNDKDQKGELK